MSHHPKGSDRRPEILAYVLDLLKRLIEGIREGLGISVLCEAGNKFFLNSEPPLPCGDEQFCYIRNPRPYAPYLPFPWGFGGALFVGRLLVRSLLYRFERKIQGQSLVQGSPE